MKGFSFSSLPMKFFVMIYYIRILAFALLMVLFTNNKSNPFTILLTILSINAIIMLILIIKKPILSKKNLIYEILIEILFNAILLCILILNIFDSKKKYDNLNTRMMVGNIIISLEIALFVFIFIGQIINFIWKKNDFE